MTNKLEKYLEFLQFTHKFQQVKRQIYVTGEDRAENDLEHSSQLALTAWYLIESLELKLDSNKAMKYALAHDLVEVYAGDTFFYDTTGKKDDKVERERKALEQINIEFSEFAELIEVIHKYEDRADSEAKFIYALDKMIPASNIYLDKGRSWQRDGITLDMLRTKHDKIAKSPEVLQIWEELVQLFEQHPDFFPTKE